MQKILLLLSLCFIFELCYAQEPDQDSARLLEPVMVTAFEQHTPVDRTPSAISILTTANADFANKTSLLSGFNTVAGVRMEERSPASYRINIRGSSLRSPFGVRNVKVYWNNIPVTDPGGNTYFNQFAFNNFSSIEIYKGPVSSMYGAGTGGLIFMNSFADNFKSSANAEYITGSYSLQNIFASTDFGEKENHSLLTYSHNSSNGYRDHSAMRRDNASFVSQNKLSAKEALTGAILFTDLFYETPGGLNKTEYDADPRAARPAAGGLPSAEQSKAAIYQKNFLAGLNHEYSFSPNFKNTSSLYGAFAQIKNPTFRNYERRNEPHFGGRTSFVFNKKMNEARIQLVAGGELQQGYFNTQVSKNKQGNPDTLQTNDDIRYNNYSVFLQADAELKQKWFFAAGISLNQADVKNTRLNKYPVLAQGRSYNSEWSPRVSLLRKLKEVAIYASMTKGFSPPTIAELLPSTGLISTFLEAEEGINYELGTKFHALKGRLYFEADAFYFKLNHALVVRKDSSNADYYVNAGNAKQKGIEVTLNYNKIFSASSAFQYFAANLAYTLSEFYYGDFIKGTTSFNGKRLPGVPQHTLSLLADLQCRKGIYLHANWYLTSGSALDDANTALASAYDLLGLRLGWKFN